MRSEIFTHAFVIEAADIDELGHVNNIVYLRWAQSLATAHWRARAPAEMVERYVWVVVRHEVDYHAPLLLGDVAEGRTWVAEAPHGAVWPRFVAIAKPGARKPAVEIKSDWCLLDVATRRLKRVPAEMLRLFLV
ncbi:MAG: thioesterase family protein [Terricaulis sp.]